MTLCDQASRSSYSVVTMTLTPASSLPTSVLVYMSRRQVSHLAAIGSGSIMATSSTREPRFRDCYAALHGRHFFDDLLLHPDLAWQLSRLYAHKRRVIRTLCQAHYWSNTFLK